jgi:hypothetical protein
VPPSRDTRIAATVLGFSALLALTVLCGSVWAAFTATTSSVGNAITAAHDWDPPTASSSLIGKTQGGIPGYIRQGGTYNVYSNVTDAGNPASGVASVTANLSSLSSGQSAASLASGAFTIGGKGYDHRSASVTANSTLAAGAYTYSLTSTDKAGFSRTQSGYTVTVDNTAPSATDVQTTNKSGNTAGRPELGDTVIFTASEQLDPNSILAGWEGTSANVVVRIENNVPTNDRLAVYNATNTTQLPLGTVNLGRTEYVSANTIFGASGTPSTMTQSAGVITIVLGTASGSPTTAALSGSMIWSPAATAIDRAGNAMSTATRTETGTADKDF